MKPSELFEAPHALISERVPLHIWGHAAWGNLELLLRLQSTLAGSFSTSAPCSLIQWTCAACRVSQRIEPSGWCPSFYQRVEMASFNPDFVETLNAAELAGVLAQEVMHPALQHQTRRGDRNPKRWNMACDFAINPMLVDAGLTLPKEVLLDHRFRGKSAERIYNLLEEEENQDTSGCHNGILGIDRRRHPRGTEVKIDSQK